MKKQNSSQYRLIADEVKDEVRLFFWGSCQATAFFSDSWEVVFKTKNFTEEEKVKFLTTLQQQYPNGT